MLSALRRERPTLSLLAAVLLQIITVVQAQKEVPSVSDFIHRDRHGSVVLGDFVYIDGGLLSQNISGALDTIIPRVNNVTLSIDLRRSWTNATVQLTAIDRGDTPVLIFPNLWPDAASASFYLWSGMAAPDRTVPNLGLWKFAADGGGGGTWGKVGQADLATFNTLTRPAGGCVAVQGDTAYHAGGYQTSSTDPAVDTADEIPVPGIVAYNFTSGAWTNDSSPTGGFTPHGTEMWGKAASVPFNSGLLVFVGGESGSRTTLDIHHGYLDLDTVAVFDPARRAWYSQVATGDVPSQRDGFCLVGAQAVAAAGANGSYELFLHGGWNAAAGVTFNDTYVLSLPAFRWFRGPDAPGRRLGHSCNVVGAGARQFLSIGGTDNTVQQPNIWRTADVWKQGLGVFDMTAMSWSAGYDADAAPYEVPQVVKAWYQSGSEPSWSNDTVKALFANETAAPSSSSSSSSTNHTPAIVGGVIAGIAGLAFLLLALFFFRRRNRRNRNAAPLASPNFADDGTAAPDPNKLPGADERYELSEHEVKELPGHGHQFGAELQSQGRNAPLVEVDGSPAPAVELDGGGRWA
ncbi:putative kelch repeat protein [Neofusicoccum parvum UCRNP2]|uniref:Putative kelch repeat protein n=1 Tax=Botryosphaeria parva (strain UCR-NP2) TaxID=1287680 RepID=R1GQ25_BOTPV|nr:putative kelch repeat protein [Neofusicoccum parvum UCRNP2]